MQDITLLLCDVNDSGTYVDVVWQHADMCLNMLFATQARI